jgi:hypothetical protein
MTMKTMLLHKLPVMRQMKPYLTHNRCFQCTHRQQLNSSGLPVENTLAVAVGVTDSDTLLEAKALAEGNTDADADRNRCH